MTRWFTQKNICQFPLIRLLLLLVMVPLACSPVATATDTADDITRADCVDFINERPSRVSCGFVDVLLNHDNPAGPSISLPVVIAHSTRDSPTSSHRAVLVPGGGGPGSSLGFGLLYAEGEYLDPYESLRQAGFDIVLLDQRGAGLSKPILTCPETIAVFKSLVTRYRSTVEEIELFHEALIQCQQRFKKSGIALEHFDTRQSALDFLSVMNSLSYTWWGTVATSYATTLAQAMMISKPDAFDRVVLDSPVPLDFQQPMTVERTTDAISKTLALCAKNNRCNRRYPDLKKKLDVVLRRAAERPFGIKIKVYSDSGDLQQKTLIVDDNTLLSILSTAIYTNDSIAALPQTIDRFYEGSKQAIKAFAEEYWYQSSDASYADGLSMTVHCKERQMLEERYMRRHPAEFDGISDYSRQALDAQRQYCSSWGVSSDNQILPKKRFTTKTLILAGGLDPVISLQDIDNTANDFSDASTAIVPRAGHSVWFQSECARRQTLAFLDDQENPVATESCDDDVPEFD